MSTNKTENLNLHAWEPEDGFLLSEFNENFSAIDAAVGALRALTHLRIASGTYTGDGVQYREIEVGFRPKLLILSGYWQVGSVAKGLTFRGGDMDITFMEDGTLIFDNNIFQFTETGFRLVSTNFNLASRRQYYIAIG